MHEREFSSYSVCPKAQRVSLSEQSYTMGFLLYQHKEKYFELVMNKLSVDKWTILVLINK